MVEDDIEKQTTPGETFFGEKFGVPYIWGENDKLIDVDEKYSSRIDYLVKYFGFKEDIFKLQLQADYKDKKILLVFSEFLKQYIDKEVKGNDEILLYLIVGS